MAKSIHRAEFHLLRQQLRQLRHRAQLTQAELSEKMGRPQSFISDIERGARSLDLIELRDICGLLGEDLVHFVRVLERELQAQSAAHGKGPVKRRK